MYIIICFLEADQLIIHVYHHHHGFLSNDYLEGKGESISKRILDCICEPLVGIDPSKICSQAYAGAAVMSSGIHCSFGSVHIHCFQTASIQLLQESQRHEVHLLLDHIHKLCESTKKAYYSRFP